MDVKKELNQVFCEVFGNPKIVISEEMTSNNIVGWDSFSHMNLIASIEIHFDIEFTQREAIGFKNVGELINSISSKRQK